MNEVITIQIFHFFNSSSAKFFYILSHKTRKKEMFLTLENLAKLLENKKFRIKNKDKVTTNYAKRFEKKKYTFSTQIKNFEDYIFGLLSKS